MIVAVCDEDDGLDRFVDLASIYDHLHFRWVIVKVVHGEYDGVIEDSCSREGSTDPWSNKL